MTDGDVPEELGFRVLRSIRRIVRRIGSYSRQIQRDTGLSVPQLMCLRAIANHDTITSAAIAELTQLSRPTVSQLVEKLVRSGYVTRERAEQDRRQVHLSLTDAGRESLAGMPRPLEDRFLNRMKDLEPEDREMILVALERVVQLMDAEDLDDGPLVSSG